MSIAVSFRKLKYFQGALAAAIDVATPKGGEISFEGHKAIEGKTTSPVSAAAIVAAALVSRREAEITIKTGNTTIVASLGGIVGSPTYVIGVKRD